MAEIASAFMSIMPSAKGFGSKLQSEVGGEVNSAGSKLGKGFGKMFALGGGLLAAAGIGSVLGDSIGEAREAQKVGALTESIIKSTGKAAGITADQVGAMAGRLSSVTGIDDEVIQQGSNLLLTFKNVKNYVDGEFVGVFDRATASAVDLSAAGFGSVDGAAKMLGKALNDPLKGISALGRAGVTFTASQQEQIKALVESGDAAKAQGLILAEVESQVGGAAAASATAGEKAAVAFGNLKEDLGTALLPVVDTVANGFVKLAPAISAGIGAIGPAFTSARAFLAPLVAQMQGLFSGGAGGGVLAGVQSFAATLSTNFLPVLRLMAATFTGTIIPAVRSVVTYVASALVPIFRQAAAIVTGQVIPIYASLARFFIGTIYPAVIKVATSVAKNLRPVFDALTQTIRGRVLPAVSTILAKLREWGPTIAKVVSAVVKIIGKVLEFAAAILGKVLPVAIRFAGFLLGNLVPAVVGVIGVVIKIIAKVVDFGTALVKAVAKAGEFLAGIRAKVGAAFDFVKGIPGKIAGVFSGAGTLLLNAGRQLMTGLAAGIGEKINEAIDKVRDGLSKIRGLLPGSPIKWGPLKNWNNGGAGKRLMALVEKGITSATPKTVKAAKGAFDKIAESLEATRDRLKGELDGLKGDFDSIKSTVAGAFTSGLFDVSATLDDDGNVTKTVGQNVVEKLMGTKAELAGLLASFKTLTGWGIDPGFLTQLFSSGNGALITEIAGMGKAGAVDTANLFGDVTNLGAQLGNAVAQNDPVADRIDETNRLLGVAIEQIAFLSGDIGKELNQAASKAQRDKKNSGKKGRGKK